jgi:hypothetical protein
LWREAATHWYVRELPRPSDDTGKCRGTNGYWRLSVGFPNAGQLRSALGKSSSAMQRLDAGQQSEPSKAIALTAGLTLVAALVASNSGSSDGAANWQEFTKIDQREMGVGHSQASVRYDGSAALRKVFSQAKREPRHHLAVLLENASRSRTRSSVLTSETAQNVKPPATQDSML